MPRKMFSFLGTSDYAEGIYTFGGDEWRTSFVQTALIRFFQPFDEIIVFVTREARSKNWSKLKEAIQRHYPHCSFNAVDIKDGKTLAEIWETFNILLSRVDENDELVLDITHSFRSIPVLVLACVQYLRSLKNIHLSGIYYGAWDAREPFKKFYGTEDPLPRSPVFDLTPFIELMDWSYGVADFIKYGQIGPLNNLTKEKSGHLPKKLRQNLKTVVESFLKLQNEILTCRGKLIHEGKRLAQIEPNLKKIKENAEELPPAFYPLVEKIETKIRQLKGWGGISVDDDIQRGFGAVSWCLEHNLVQQAFTLLQENLITYFCRASGLNDREKSPDRRIASISSSVFFLPFEQWDQFAREHEVEIRKVHAGIGEYLMKLFRELSEIRNDINHAGMTCETKPETLRKKVQDCHNKVQTWFLNTDGR